MKRLTAIVMLAALATGCRDRPKPKPGAEADVGGTAISRDGEPLEGYALRFQSDPPDEVNSAITCFIRKDGKFTGKCRAGRYRVTLVRPPKGKDAEEKPGPAPQYWELTVPEGGKKTFVLQAE